MFTIDLSKIEGSAHILIKNSYLGLKMVVKRHRLDRESFFLKISFNAGVI